VKWDEQALAGLDANYPLAKGTYFSGGAGLSSTIVDYATFLQMLLDGGEYNGKRLLAARTVDLMISKPDRQPGSGSRQIRPGFRDHHGGRSGPAGCYRRIVCLGRLLGNHLLG